MILLHMLFLESFTMNVSDDKKQYLIEKKKMHQSECI